MPAPSYRVKLKANGGTCARPALECVGGAVSAAWVQAHGAQAVSAQAVGAQTVGAQALGAAPALPFSLVVLCCPVVSFLEVSYATFAINCDLST